ncbi:MAG: hypothetical protein K8S21_11900 [Gemmatimonadetes bacterium]|nr:hypothetical protein [Gemmatimonadota bacterium]
MSALVLALIVGCGDGTSGGVTPPITGSLTEGTWYMHQANGTDLPAVISTRFVGVAVEETTLDSARIVIDGNSGWEQRYYMTITLTGIIDRREVVFDKGIWGDGGPGFTFSSSVRVRSFSASVTTPGVLSTVEQMLFFTAAPAVSGTYRLTRP